MYTQPVTESPLIPTTVPPTITPVTPTPTNITIIPSDLTKDPYSTKAINVTNGLCYKYKGSQFIIQGLTNLSSIVIGDNCFRNVRWFELNGLKELEALSIGKDCFRMAKSERSDGSFQIANCPNLTTVVLSEYSFYDYHVFELNNLTSLQSIIVNMRCFVFTPSFSLTSITIVRLLFTDLPQLQSVRIGFSAFLFSHFVQFKSI